MRFSNFTDYALRLLLMVQEAGGERITIEQAASRHRISRANLMKVANELTKAGVLTGVRGRAGGLILAKPADSIGIGDVVQAMEPDFALVECFTAANECAISNMCRLPHVLNRGKAAMIAELNRTTLADVALGSRIHQKQTSHSQVETSNATSNDTNLTDQRIHVIYSDISTSSARSYDSPTRRAQAEETHNRILTALADIIAQSEGGDALIDEVARSAGVDRRTVFRYFPNKEALLEAFWTWINARTSGQNLPTTLPDLLRLPVEVFEGFDSNEGVIRASLHSKAGRQMRLAALPKRHAAFGKAISGILGHCHPEDRRPFEALVHLLYSAAAWETLKDYCGMSGAEAGATVSWGLERLVQSLDPTEPHNLQKGDV